MSSLESFRIATLGGTYIPAKRTLLGCMLGCCLLLQSSPIHATWNLIAQFPERVSAIYFFDAQTGFVGLEGANELERTTDGGKSWTPCVIPGSTSSNNIWFGDIWFSSRTEGWATLVYGNGPSCLLHTIDGGIDWENTSGFGNACSVRQTSKAVVLTQWSGTLLVSTDGGATFVDQFVNNVNGVDFVDDLHGAISGFITEFLYTSEHTSPAHFLQY